MSGWCHLLEKYGKFYADWEDQFGKRKRKAFDSKSQALSFQTRQRKQAAAKKAQASPRSRSSRKAGARPTPKTRAKRARAGRQ